MRGDEIGRQPGQFTRIGGNGLAAIGDALVELAAQIRNPVSQCLRHFALLRRQRHPRTLEIAERALEQQPGRRIGRSQRYRLDPLIDRPRQRDLVARRREPHFAIAPGLAPRVVR